MSLDRNVYGVWRVPSSRVKKSTSPMIGIIYTALYKGKEVVGVLERVGGIEAFIRTKENKLLSVDKKSLKIYM